MPQKRCSVAKRLPYIMNIFCCFFSAQLTPQSKDLEANSMLEILKKLSKTGDRFTAIEPHLRNCCSVLGFC